MFETTNEQQSQSSVIVVTNSSVVGVGVGVGVGVSAAAVSNMSTLIDSVNSTHLHHFHHYHHHHHHIVNNNNKNRHNHFNRSNEITSNSCNGVNCTSNGISCNGTNAGGNVTSASSSSSLSNNKDVVETQNQLAQSNTINLFSSYFKNLIEKQHQQSTAMTNGNSTNLIPTTNLQIHDNDELGKSKSKQSQLIKTLTDTLTSTGENVKSVSDQDEKLENLITSNGCHSDSDQKDTNIINNKRLKLDKPAENAACNTILLSTQNLLNSVMNKKRKMSKNKNKKLKLDTNNNKIETDTSNIHNEHLNNGFLNTSKKTNTISNNNTNSHVTKESEINADEHFTTMNGNSDTSVVGDNSTKFFNLSSLNLNLVSVFETKNDKKSKEPKMNGATSSNSVSSYAKKKLKSLNKAIINKSKLIKLLNYKNSLRIIKKFKKYKLVKSSYKKLVNDHEHNDDDDEQVDRHNETSSIDLNQSAKFLKKSSLTAIENPCFISDVDTNNNKSCCLEQQIVVSSSQNRSNMIANSNKVSCLNRKVANLSSESLPTTSLNTSSTANLNNDSSNENYFTSSISNHNNSNKTDNEQVDSENMKLIDNVNENFLYSINQSQQIVAPTGDIEMILTNESRYRHSNDHHNHHHHHHHLNHLQQLDQQQPQSSLNYLIDDSSSNGSALNTCQTANLTANISSLSCITNNSLYSFMFNHHHHQAFNPNIYNSNNRIRQDLLKLSYDKFKQFRLNEKLLQQTVLIRNAIKLLQYELQYQQDQELQQQYIIQQQQQQQQHQQQLIDYENCLNTSNRLLSNGSYVTNVTHNTNGVLNMSTNGTPASSFENLDEFFNRSNTTNDFSNKTNYTNLFTSNSVIINEPNSISCSNTSYSCNTMNPTLGAKLSSTSLEIDCDKDDATNYFNSLDQNHQHMDNAINVANVSNQGELRDDEEVEDVEIENDYDEDEEEEDEDDDEDEDEDEEEDDEEDDEENENEDVDADIEIKDQQQTNENHDQIDENEAHKQDRLDENNVILPNNQSKNSAVTLEEENPSNDNIPQNDN